MVDFQEEINVDGRRVMTLRNIVPATGPMRMLIVGKTPTPRGVESGHYFRGVQGRMFWKRLKDYGLLRVPPGLYEDEVLLEHGYGITNVVRTPHPFGSEPSTDDYRHGIRQVLALIKELAPHIVLFVYKRVLDQTLHLRYGLRTKAWYGFNPDFDPLLNARVFVFPMPGTPCRSAEGHRAMSELRQALDATWPGCDQ